MFRKIHHALGFIIAVMVTVDVSAESPKAIMEKVVDRLKFQSISDDQYGFYQQVRHRKFESDFQRVKDEELRVYRTIWILERPYSQLIRMNDQKLDAVQKAKESRRKSEFVKERTGQGRKSGNGIGQEFKKIRWSEMYSRYDYKFEAPDSGAGYVISFKPKAENFFAETRIEKVLKEIQGKVWIDTEFNILKVEASLIGGVNFGFGLIARIEQMHTIYTQQKFENIWIPASLRTTFQARIAMLRTERQELQVNWYEPFRRSTQNLTVVAAGL